MDSSPALRLRQVTAPEAVAEDMSPSLNCDGDDATSARATLSSWRLNREAIERARLLAGKTRRDLAAAAHIDDKTLRDMLNGRRRPNISTAHCVIRTLALDPKEIILFADDL